MYPKLPINTSKISYKENIVNNGKVVVFHGINRKGTKGTALVEEAFNILNTKYPNDLECVCAGGLPLNEYQELLNRVNICIDQTYSPESGMNALISMAKGKVVLGGADPTFTSAMGLSDTPLVDISPSVKDIINKIEKLLDNRKSLPEMGRSARDFVEKHHDCRIIANRYIDLWNTYLKAQPEAS